MNLTMRDWVILAIIVAVLGFLFMGKSRLKAGNVPENDTHRSFYESMNKGSDRAEVEKGCNVCHGIKGTPLSKGHPPKEQCLICHKLIQKK